MGNNSNSKKIIRPQNIEKISKIQSNTKFKDLKKECKDNIKFSFESLQFNEYFNLNGTCANWAFELLTKLVALSKYTVPELKGEGSAGTFRNHNHEKKAYFEPPYNLNKDEFQQIRIGTSKGGIHGVFVENTFYVIWLDPHHNMYPKNKFGRLRKIIPPSTCCKERDTEIIQLIEENIKLADELKFWEEVAATSE